MKKILFISLLLLLLAGCDTFHGCGHIVGIPAPQPQYDYYNTEWGRVRIPNGKYYYPLVVKGENGKNYTVYTNLNSYNSAKIGDIFCAE